MDQQDPPVTAVPLQAPLPTGSSGPTEGSETTATATAVNREYDTIRQRKSATTVKGHASIPSGDASVESNADEKDQKDTTEGVEINWGKTPSGQVFRVPQTVSFVTTLLTTLHRSSLTLWTFISLIAQPALFYVLRNHHLLRSTFFMAYFAFWRGAYDFGFAWVLRQQSERRWVVRLLRAWGWLDVNSEQGGEAGRAWARWWKRELEMKMEKGYKWDDVPQEFNSWLMFRQLVDVVLLNDFVSYTCFAWSNLHFPANHSVAMHILRWTLGWGLILFNLWVKIDAHRVVKDYAWYWGDAFWMMVMQHELVFDGVYEIAPHPMYSVGYAGYYGLSMVVGSYAVLFVSLAAHAAQFAFLLWFENPHIERTYGGAKKPLASRVPLAWGQSSSTPSQTQSSAASVLSADAEPSHMHASPVDMPSRGQTMPPTPSVTEGRNSHPGETDAEPELAELPTHDSQSAPGVSVRKSRSDSSYSAISAASHGSSPEMVSVPKMTAGVRPSHAPRRRARTITMHDLTHRYFRKPAVVLWRLDVFRATDFAMIVLVLYGLITLVPALPPSLGLAAHFLHALAWRVFHSFGLGLLLRAQSKGKWLVRHYLKHYHYPGSTHGSAEAAGSGDRGVIAGGRDDEGGVEGQNESVVKRATEEAFGNWQVGYNISLVMTYVSFAGLAWKTYHLPSDWTVSGTILRHVLGFLLIALHVWSARSTYEVLGDFGWLYSDFFLTEHIPAQLAYTGIYRFLNNPERSMGAAAFFGLWLVSNSKLVFALALISHLGHWWFLSAVERPHMQRLYGDRLRKDGGLTKTLKSVAGKTLAQKAGRHAPEIQRVVQEVRGSIEKVEERVTEAVEEFLGHARPMFSDMVHDTRILLQQSRERMIITRISSDIASYDASRYNIQLATSSSAPSATYHVGQPIRVSWTAPRKHSRKDWIGIYRLGSNKSALVTRISSVGKWMPIYEDEYDGDRQIEREGNVGGTEKDAEDADAGSVLFKGDKLPWAPGRYELRYHHDGKHNVLARVEPIEIVVNKPKDDSLEAAHETLLDIVALSLDDEAALVPVAARAKVRARAAKDRAAMARVNTQGAAVGKVPGGHGRCASRVSFVDVDGLAALTRGAKPTIGAEAGDEGDSTPRAEVDNDKADSLLGAAVDKGKHREQLDQLDEVSSAGMGSEYEHDADADADADIDPDDFVIMSETQAKRIVAMCELAFGVEMSSDVVVADANVGALARRVVGARGLSGGRVAGNEAGQGVVMDGGMGVKKGPGTDGAM